MDTRLKEEVRQRANHRCEYCLFPERFAELRFQIDHIIPQQHGGLTHAHNLALACFRCNKCKGPNLSGIDPISGEIVRLFQPRVDLWRDHFAWIGPQIASLTPTGRATVNVLQLNRAEAVLVRQALMEEGLFFAEQN